MLTAAAAILGAATVVGFFSFDIDSDALETCKENLEELEITTAELVQADVRQLVLSHSRFTKLFDTVVLNPPFGTKCNQGIDLEFVRVALELSHGSVYSLHKTSTRPHILKTAGRWGLEVQVLARLRYDLPSTYKFHKKKSVDIEVDVIKFTHK
ncbi:Methyltransferase-like protein 5 [Chionoecetes opilio]|uniref:Methyltransferase-like protein 5 n=1 Tax=Chionoecetes opilio TaxID=41210 RepID=A0A8J4XXN2_CHIOP|nr:Methyltransferase-like protein 5 [Chionoecetes opilio]